MTIRPRRSVLYMPGANARALEKAKTLDADALILDLEDSVAPDAKSVARSRVAEAVKQPGQFDVVVDSAGGEGFGKLIDVTASGGRVVFYGATRGDAPLPVRKGFWRQISLLGTRMGSPGDPETSSS